MPLPEKPEPEAGPRRYWRDLAAMFGSVPPGRLALVLLLMLGSALSEGIGIAMLVPLLELAGGNAAQSGLAKALSTAGLPLTLGAVLTAFVIVIALRSALVYWLGKLRLDLQLSFADRLRRRCHAALVHANWRWLSSQRAADHNAALVTNSNFAGVALDQTLGLAATLVTMLVLAAISFAVSWQVTLAALLLGVVAFGAVSPLLRRAMETGRATNLANREMHRQVEQGIARFRETKILGGEDAEVAEFERISVAIRARKMRHRDDSALGSVMIQLAGTVLLAFLVYVGTARTGLSLPELLPLLLVFLRLVPLLQAAQLGWTQWLHALPALHELERITSQASAEAEPAAPVGDRITLQREIALRNVTVHHPGRDHPALEIIDLRVPSGSTIAVMGPSGAGKSTLADLIGGLIAPDHGSVTIDSTALEGQTMRSWRRSVAYVQQNPLLHHGTIRENLNWARPEASSAELAGVLKRASAEFVLALPDGLDTAIGDAGLRLSGGERQRIAIARALLRDPQLLILDEVTSALDADNEVAVLETVAAMRGHLTIVMIGHRPAMTALADQVIELEAGRIADRS